MDNPSAYFFSGDVFNPILLVTNVQATTILAGIVLVLLLLSFFIAGGEVAFFSLTYRDINVLKTKQDSSLKRIATLLEEPRPLQASLMIANTLINIAIIILANFLIDQILAFKQGYWPIGFLGFVIKVLVISSLIILFGEVLPKVRASQNNLRFASEVSLLVEVIYYLFKRIGVWLIKIAERNPVATGRSY